MLEFNVAAVVAVAGSKSKGEVGTPCWNPMLMLLMLLLISLFFIEVPAAVVAVAGVMKVKILLFLQVIIVAGSVPVLEKDHVPCHVVEENFLYKGT